MSVKSQKTKNSELQIRAITAKMALRKMGINYCVVLVNEDSTLDASRVYQVANGKLADEAITSKLEELVAKHTTVAA